MRIPCRALLLATLTLAATGAADIARADQSRAPSVSRAPANAAAEQQAPAKVALSVGGKSYELSQSARCVHAARASMYNKLGEYWTVELPNGGSGLRSLLVTTWRFNDKSQAFTLSVAADRAYQVSTMAGATNAGHGTVTLTPRGTGGQFTVDATTSQGVAIRGTIDCERFAAAVAAGG